MTCRSCKKSIGRQRPAAQRVAGMFAQEPPPDFDVPGRREPGERPELVAEVGLVEVACATGEVAPVDRSGGVDREHGGGEAVGAGQPLRRDADKLLEPRCQMSARAGPQSLTQRSRHFPGHVSEHVFEYGHANTSRLRTVGSALPDPRARTLRGDAGSMPGGSRP